MRNEGTLETSIPKAQGLPSHFCQEWGELVLWMYWRPSLPLPLSREMRPFL